MEIRLIHSESGQTLAERVEVPAGPWQRMRGLLGRSSLPEGAAMLFKRCSSIHMMFMKFPIDVLFLDGDYMVTKVVHALRPWRMAAGVGAWHVVELPAGTLERIPVQPGDTLLVEERT